MPATEPEQIHRLFEQAFNAGDVEALMALYEPDAALIPQPGAVAEGTAAIRDSLRWFLDRRGKITLTRKLVVRVGDLAFLMNRWSLTGGTMPDGSPAELGATTAEVARLQPDGTWLYVIDNAWGDQAAPGGIFERARIKASESQRLPEQRAGWSADQGSAIASYEFR
jgi:uncharacterized protein (TIGR02246 family)